MADIDYTIMDNERRQLIDKYLEYLERDYGVTNHLERNQLIVDLSEKTDFDSITINLPDDFINLSYEISDFLDYMSDIDSLQEVDKTTSRTNHIRQTVIDFKYFGSDQYVDKLLSYSFVDMDYQIKVVKQPLLIGLTNAKNENYDDHLGLGCSEPYMALELRYTGTKRLSKESEDGLFERISFFLTKELKTSIYITSVRDVRTVWDEFYQDDDKESSIDSVVVKVNDLINYSPMLKLYKQALATEDLEIRFLQFYKIIEYISPIVSKMEAYDKLNKRLDVLASSGRDYNYLNSILSIARKFDNDLRDDTLAVSVIKSCVDVVPLWSYLPKRLQKQIKNTLHIQDDTLNDDIKADQLLSLQIQIANILYSTRNNIVHAKSNYIPNGLELQDDELEKGNEMMDIISMSIIQWNERQPESYRV